MAILFYIILTAACAFGLFFLAIAFLHDKAEYEERADAQPVCSQREEEEQPECIPVGQHWDQGVRVGS